MSDLVRTVGVDPERVAVRGGAGALTWGELDRQVSHCAQSFIAAGLTPGDRVALHLGTRNEFVVLYFGALRAGLVVVPVNPAYTVAELSYVLADSAARLLLTESVAALRARPDLPVARVVAVPSSAAVSEVEQPGDDAAGAELTYQQFLGHAASLEDPALDRTGEALAVLLYTSGTTGQPKGAMLSVRALLGNLAQVASVEPAPVRDTDIAFVPLPLFHVYGLNAALAVALYAGASVVLAERFDAGATLALMAEQAVTTVVGAPGMFVQWAAHPDVQTGFASVRFALSGSAPLSPSLVARYAEIGVPLFEGYGLTETAPVLTMNAIGLGVTPRAGSVGRPLPGIEAQLRNQDGSAVDPEDEDPGQLFVRGANLFSGYWPDGRGGPDADGWFATGDIALLEPSGGIRLVGRTSDLIIVNGFNVYPAEVERALASAPGVAEVAVVGVPDAQTGEAVAAFVVPVPGVELSGDDVLTHASGQLARFKRPRSVEVVEALPHTVTGKVQKWRLIPDAAAASARTA